MYLNKKAKSKLGYLIFFLKKNLRKIGASVLIKDKPHVQLQKETSIFSLTSDTSFLL
jgi:hypothetical protein